MMDIGYHVSPNDRGLCGAATDTTTMMALARLALPGHEPPVEVTPKLHWLEPHLPPLNGRFSAISFRVALPQPGHQPTLQQGEYLEAGRPVTVAEADVQVWPLSGSGSKFRYRTLLFFPSRHAQTPRLILA